MRKLLSISCLAASLILIQACGNGSKTESTKIADSANNAKIDTTKNNPDTIAIDVDKSDAEFVVKAANGGIAEVDLAIIAQQKTKNSEVNEFAAMMIADHTMANEELKALAAKKNITLPSSVGKDELKIKDELTRKEAKDFDRAYVDAMVKDHKNDIKLFEDGSKKLKDNELKAFVDRTLPTLKKHLADIQELQKKVK
ncbi:DUF4142 domain-containing protein [Pedobacter aquatilis]|uniref:DUF4142 domain-containing protein n=1 Tax=Pedobacter aquatilis TaxID=351343 RepID=UPI0025B5973C|nr:DUF4142 domain-containing protein [Pedobacter aquatilis]MDN3588841.1 DUF4142 domain-containing protein [Pedobacter aquatilis]